jgi:hypothetical protein
VKRQVVGVSLVGGASRAGGAAMHTVLTFISRVDPARLAELRRHLDEIAADVRGNRLVPFGRLARTHFASLTIFPDDEYGPYLVFEHNFDGPLDPYLDDLIAHAGPGLDRIYRCCDDYRPPDDGGRAPPAAPRATPPAYLRAYLRARVQRPSAYHVGNVGRSVRQVHEERRLRDEIEAHLDGLVRDGTIGATPAAIRAQVQAFVEARGDADRVRAVRPRLTPLQKHGPNLAIGGMLLGALLAWRAVLFVGVPGLALWAAVLRWKEARDPVWSGLAPFDHVLRLRDQEDRPLVVQNHMANLARVKPGPFRRWTLRAVLFAANLLARRSTNGTLSGIPSIHFAHWAQIDGGARLLFLSNYDGSWENYLDDFIDKASNGLTAIWGHTVEFPRVRWLVGEGSRDGPNFKEIARDRSQPSHVWYSAYPDLTVQQIDKNSALRERLFAPLDADAERAWVRSL